jgi:hypothetical protein
MPKDKGRRGNRRETSALDTSRVGGSTGPTGSTDSRAQVFLQRERIHEEIKDAIHNKDENLEKFISQKSMRKIWTEGRLMRFFKILHPEYDHTALLFAEENLLSTLSILVTIRWPHWSTFWELFFDSRDSSGKQNHLDHSIPYPLSTLNDESFLGEWASDFQSIQHVFIPIVVERGQIKDYPKEYRLPFINHERKEIGEGGFGKVTKEVIASHQLRQYNLVNEVGFLPPPPLSNFEL